MRVPVSEQEPKKRINNFDEVCLGYSPEQAIQEATRCLQCRDPRCVKKCPVNIDIPAFLKKIVEKDVDSALEIIKKTNNLPGICGRVCPQERQCELGCILGLKQESISIGKLERFAADNGKCKKIKPTKKNGRKIAVVGSGPAGLTCASDLNKLGYEVTIYEALHVAGGVLMYGIPEFRLPKKIVKKEISELEEEGVTIKKNYIIGRTLTLKELYESNDAVFICSGAGLPYFMNLQGEDLVNVMSANEFLTRVNLMKAYDFPKSNTPIKKGIRTIVIGCGNTALDAARTARRLGSHVTIVYRRTIADAPARQEEIKHAHEEGIQFMFLTSPKKFLGDRKVNSVELMQMHIVEEEDTGKRISMPMENSEFTLEADQVIIAVGQGPNPLLIKDSGLDVDDAGQIIVDENNRTNIPNVFAGGDIIEGEATVIKAMGDGKKVAAIINDFLGSSAAPAIKETAKSAKTKVKPEKKAKKKK
jgi:glutamate synthase (NADPH/NADH) small chain